MSARVALYIAVILLLLLALAVIVVAALIRRPRREWQIAVMGQTQEVRGTGLADLRLQTVKPRRVSLDEMWATESVPQTAYVGVPRLPDRSTVAYAIAPLGRDLIRDMVVVPADEVPAAPDPYLGEPGDAYDEQFKPMATQREDPELVQDYLATIEPPPAPPPPSVDQESSLDWLQEAYSAPGEPRISLPALSSMRGLFSVSEFPPDPGPSSSVPPPTDAETEDVAALGQLSDAVAYVEPILELELDAQAQRDVEAELDAEHMPGGAEAEFMPGGDEAGLELEQETEPPAAAFIEEEVTEDVEPDSAEMAAYAQDEVSAPLEDIEGAAGIDVEMDTQTDADTRTEAETDMEARAGGDAKDNEDRDLVGIDDE